VGCNRPHPRPHGIHVGEAAPSNGDHPDYLSPALNSLGRLLAAGHGGQTLLSNAVRILAADTLPDEVSLRDLGRHQLRDQLEAEQIWQLLIPGLLDNYPPLKTLDRHSTNLPRQSTPLIGRDALLAKLLPILTDPGTRHLTLTGRVASARRASRSNSLPTPQMPFPTAHSSSTSPP
jgi:hypothetical protein